MRYFLGQTLYRAGCEDTSVGRYLSRGHGERGNSPTSYWTCIVVRGEEVCEHLAHLTSRESIIVPEESTTRIESWGWFGDGPT